ncbi:MAG TPA: hypothetical protein VN577_12760 [Terriglobales bacterium]|nr:hypothetical protein [Terriglobales bacterium]
MLKSFVSATAVCAIAIACGALILFAFAHNSTLNNPYQVALLWCMAPVTWGIWAMLTPKAWMPEKLPYWGAILGLIAGTGATLVLNIPGRIMGAYVRYRWRGLMVLLAIALYYALWMGVRGLYKTLFRPTVDQKFKAAA